MMSYSNQGVIIALKVRIHTSYFYFWQFKIITITLNIFISSLNLFITTIESMVNCKWLLNNYCWQYIHISVFCPNLLELNTVMITFVIHCILELLG
jgi:hypothetical protein